MDKYEKMRKQFKADGADDLMIEKFIREEKERDEFEKKSGTIDLEAVKEWNKLPEKEQQIFLSSAFCMNCGVTTFGKGYTLRMDRFGIVIEGNCSKCGHKIARVVE